MFAWTPDGKGCLERLFQSRPDNENRLTSLFLLNSEAGGSSSPFGPGPANLALETREFELQSFMLDVIARDGPCPARPTDEIGHRAGEFLVVGREVGPRRADPIAQVPGRALPAVRPEELVEVGSGEHLSPLFRQGEAHDEEGTFRALRRVDGLGWRDRSLSAAGPSRPDRGRLAGSTTREHRRHPARGEVEPRGYTPGEIVAQNTGRQIAENRGQLSDRPVAALGTAGVGPVEDAIDVEGHERHRRLRPAPAEHRRPRAR